ncbi:MAG: hypothetical protein ABI601_10385 [bacterium]
MMLEAITRRRHTAAEKPPRRSAPAKHGPATPTVPDTSYAGAFARVRLIRAWIGVAAATVALGYAFAALLDRLLT